MAVDFYDKWLSFWSESEEQRRKARKAISEDELQWVSTKQDKRVAILAGPETGFYSMGGVIMLVEIPVGWRTGKCCGGELAMYILEGEGCSVVDGLRYDWEKGAAVWIPYGATYQHYNTGNKLVRFVAANAVQLERSVGLARIIQYESCSEIPRGEPKEPKEPSGILVDVGRIVLHSKDAPVRIVSAEEQKSGVHCHTRCVELMGRAGTGFTAREVAITDIMCDNPIAKTGRHAPGHAHMEAFIYVLKGRGYSIIEGEKIEWKKGTLLHVQGPQTWHEHYNSGDEESQLMRIQFGIREFFYEKIASRTFPQR